jgi:type I restriction enzyme M protein
LDYSQGGTEAEQKIKEVFGSDPVYSDVLGLCKVASLDEIEISGWSLNPGKYVGVSPDEEVEDSNFFIKVSQLQEELDELNAQCHALEKSILTNVEDVLRDGNEV